MQNLSMRLREVAYEAMGARDLDVESAYFAFAPKEVGDLRIKLSRPNFQPTGAKSYISDKKGFSGINEGAWELHRRAA